MAANLVYDKFWVDKCVYHDAERKFHESLAKLHKNGQKCEEVGKSGQKSDEVNKKPKENKNVKAQMKYQKNSENAESHIGTKKELSNVAEKNAKNSAISMMNANADSLKMGVQKNIDLKEDDIISEKEESLKETEKKAKQKEVKEKKNKSEKKSKKNRDKDENKVGGVGMANVPQESFPKTSLAGEVAKARQHIKSSLESMDGLAASTGLASENARLTSIVDKLEAKICSLEKRVEILEKKCSTCAPVSTSVGQVQTAATKTSVGQSQTVAAKTSVGQSQTKPAKNDDDDDVDLFGSESEEEDESSKKLREQRLAEYAAKKSKKPALIAKSNIILDVKPWDDETDMKKLESCVRAIKMDGLVWGASKLVPLAYGIHKLQISCVVEDDKVSVDTLTESIEEISDYVQSVDIAAFNKV